MRTPGSAVDRLRFCNYVEMVNQGFSKREIERQGGPSIRWQNDYLAQRMSDKRLDQLNDWLRHYEENKKKGLVDPKRFTSNPDAMQKALGRQQLSEEAERALDDFEFFRARYFGHISLPWHIESARIAKEAYESDGRQFICENVFPGSGKSTLKRDIVMWLIVRNRAIRALWGAASLRLASRETATIRANFERLSPIKQDIDLIAKGRAVDAEATRGLRDVAATIREHALDVLPLRAPATAPPRSWGERGPRGLRSGARTR